MRRILCLLVASLVVFSACEPANGPDIAVSSPDDFLGLSRRLVFSTANEEPRPARVVTVSNTGDTTLSVSSVTIGGTNPASFALTAGQPSAFDVAAGASATVSVEYRPPVTQTTTTTETATLTIASNDEDTPSTTVALKGLNAAYYESGGEPTLAKILSAFGYATTVPLGTSRPRWPVADEVISPYWTRADTTKPVRLVPLARYSTRTAGATGATGWHAKGSTANNALYTFPGCGSACVNGNPQDPAESGGQNQRLLPAYTGTTDFTPGGTFGLYAGGADFQYSDDGRNGVDQTHNLRFFPAEGPGGVAILNAWIMADDLGKVAADTTKNFDYQDYVFLLLNATPELSGGPVPGSTSVVNQFDAAVDGTVADNDGEGTGFTSVQASSAGHQPGLIDLDVTTGRLHLTSTDGSSSGGSNQQANALQENFDGIRPQIYRVTGRVLGPLTNLTGAFQHEAVFFGPDNNNFIKVEAEYRDGVPTLVVYAEQGGTIDTTVLTFGPTLDPLTTLTLDLRIEANPDLRTLQAKYRVNSDTASYTNVGPAFAPLDSMRWFSRQASAGLFVSDQGAAGSFTGTWERFTIAV